MSIGTKLAVVTAALVFSSSARAEERWLVSAGGGLTHAVSDPQSDLFGMGATGTASFYRSLIPWLAIGTRFTASVVSNVNTGPDDPAVEDPGTGGLYTLTLGPRVRPFADPDVAARATGLWLEGGGGIARTGALWRPAVEASVGYGINIGPVVLSPMARYQQVIHSGDALDDTDGRFASGGLEITFNDGSDEAYDPGPVYIAMASVDADHDGLPDPHDACPYLAEDFDGFRDEDGCPEHDVDGDSIADASDACPDDPETVNGINDHDGCPDSDALEVVNGIIVIDERILFAFDSYKIRPAGLAKLQDLAVRAAGHASWIGFVVEGHADVRGPHEYNQELSVKRARAVQQALLQAGLDLPIEAVGYGEDRPIDPSHHKRNRRVEIRVEEETRRATAEASTRTMTIPEPEDAL